MTVASVEARVVDCAANGRSLADIARRNGLTLGEVREVLTRRGWDVPADPGMRPRWVGALTVVEEPAQPAAPRLTEREVIVLTAVADGLTDQQIAARDFLSVSTIHTQVKSACARLGARSRAQAVAIAFRAGILR